MRALRRDAAPAPALGRPYVPGSPLDPGTPVRPLARPLIGDSIPFPDREPSAPPAPPGTGTSPALYCGPGWTARLMDARVRDGEWDELPAIIEAGFGRNAAAEAAMRRHSRAAVAEAARRLCALLGRPDLAAPLLHRVHELNVAARSAAEGGAR